MTEERSHDETRRIVREAYARTAQGPSRDPVHSKGGGRNGPASSGCCGPNPAIPEAPAPTTHVPASQGCCGPSTGPETGAEGRAQGVGYSAGELEGLPEGANLGLGCGNPAAIAALRPGETVLDLGSGGGIDCFLAAKQVGPQGRVIGVDMTPEMVSRARGNAEKAGANNISFRLGEIEHLPVADATVDVVISNCVINLSPDKHAVYREAFRVLKPGGRLAISDVVVTAPLPEELRNDAALLAGCVAGAATLEEVEAILADTGFEQIRLAPKEQSRAFIRDWAPGRKLEDVILSATIEAVKPG